MRAQHRLNFIVVLLHLFVIQLNPFHSSFSFLIKIILLISTQFGKLYFVLSFILFKPERSLQYIFISICYLFLQLLGPFRYNSENWGIFHIKNLCLDIFFRINLSITGQFRSNEVMSIFHDFLFIFLLLLSHLLFWWFFFDIWLTK